jgi:hypothetical protein
MGATRMQVHMVTRNQAPAGLIAWNAAERVYSGMAPHGGVPIIIGPDRGEVLRGVLNDHKARAEAYRSNPERKQTPAASRRTSPLHGRMARRYQELIRLLRYRAHYGVDLGQPDMLALVIADTLTFRRHGADWESFREFSQAAGLALDEAIIMTALRKIRERVEGREAARLRAKKRGANELPERYKPFHARAVARMLEITTEEKLHLELRTVASIDETPEQEAARRAEEVREYERERSGRRRTEAKAVSGKSPSTTELEPWKADGVSRATWYRRLKAAPAGPVRQKATGHNTRVSSASSPVAGCLTPPDAGALIAGSGPQAPAIDGVSDRDVIVLSDHRDGPPRGPSALSAAEPAPEPTTYVDLGDDDQPERTAASAADLGGCHAFAGNVSDAGQAGRSEAGRGPISEVSENGFFPDLETTSGFSPASGKSSHATDPAARPGTGEREATGREAQFERPSKTTGYVSDIVGIPHNKLVETRRRGGIKPAGHRATVAQTPRVEPPAGNDGRLPEQRAAVARCRAAPIAPDVRPPVGRLPQAIDPPSLPGIGDRDELPEMGERKSAMLPEGISVSGTPSWADRRRDLDAIIARRREREREAEETAWAERMACWPRFPTSTPSGGPH